MSDDKVLAQRERVRELDGKHRWMRLLHGTELNIGPDGEVDWPEEFLAGFDLRDEDILRAKRFGAKFAIDSDAHSAVHLGQLRYGVGTAQRGWVTSDDVINTWPLKKLRAFLKKVRPGVSAIP